MKESFMVLFLRFRAMGQSLRVPGGCGEVRVESTQIQYQLTGRSLEDRNILTCDISLRSKGNGSMHSPRKMGPSDRSRHHEGPLPSCICTRLIVSLALSTWLYPISVPVAIVPVGHK
jgi:hypothetical protein